MELEHCCKRERRRRGDLLLFPVRAICGYKLERNPPFCWLDQETQVSSIKRKGGKKLNEHVLASQINLLQKFQVENNFDLDEMDESKEKRKEKGSFTLESWFWALLSLDRFKYLSRINILTYEVPHLSGVGLERNLYTLCEYLNRFLFDTAS